MARKPFNDTACSLLGFLLDQPRSGYELSDVVSKTAAHFWHITQSQIYRELLVKGGERGVRAKRTYEITDAGREVFQQWVNREPEDHSGRVPLLLMTWFGDHVDKDNYEWAMQLHRRKRLEKHDWLKSVYDALPDQSTPGARCLRFGIFFERAFIDWFDSLPEFGGVERKSGADTPRPLEPETEPEFIAPDRPPKVV